MTPTPSQAQNLTKGVVKKLEDTGSFIRNDLEARQGIRDPQGPQSPIPTVPAPPGVIPEPNPIIVIEGGKQRVVNPPARGTARRDSPERNEPPKPPQLTDKVKNPKNFQPLTAPSTPGSTPSTPAWHNDRYLSPTNETFVGVKRTPGGISLSEAAAERMALNISLEGAHFENGRLVLAGHSRKEGSIDAALLLTAVRAACGKADPYFSLDPDDGAAWSRESDEAAKIFKDRATNDLFGRAKAKFHANKLENFEVKTVSLRRDYPQLQQSLSLKYPHLDARLVFSPEWLRLTRFGEILYKADVLLKELSVGAPVLKAGGVRAATIEHYMPAMERRASMLLLAQVQGDTKKVNTGHWEGHRLWFDLLSDRERENAADALCRKDPRIMCRAPSINPLSPAILESASRPIRRDPALEAILRARGYYDERPRSEGVSLVSDGDTLDLSKLYPRMFVKRHDSATRKDLEGDSPDLDALSGDVNARMERYAAKYEELQALVEVFRAYVSAVKIVRTAPQICSGIRPDPTDAEKIARPLPDHHPHEMFVTMVFYQAKSPKGRMLWGSSVTSINGGVSVAGKLVVAADLIPEKPTELTKAFNRELAEHKDRDEVAWQSRSGLQFVAFTVDPPETIEVPMTPQRSYELKGRSLDELPLLYQDHTISPKHLHGLAKPLPIPEVRSIAPSGPAVIPVDPKVTKFMLCADRKNASECRRVAACKWYGKFHSNPVREKPLALEVHESQTDGICMPN